MGLNKKYFASAKVQKVENVLRICFGSTQPNICFFFLHSKNSWCFKVGLLFHQPNLSLSFRQQNYVFVFTTVVSVSSTDFLPCINLRKPKNSYHFTFQNEINIKDNNSILVSQTSLFCLWQNQHVCERVIFCFHDPDFKNLKTDVNSVTHIFKFMMVAVWSRCTAPKNGFWDISLTHAMRNCKKKR